MVPIWDLQPLRAATIGFYHTILCMSSPKIHYFSGFQDIFRDCFQPQIFDIITYMFTNMQMKNSHI